MIEIVTDKDRNLKNLKQIGTPKDEDKIYIENFTYIKIKEDSFKDKRVFVLMGHTERMQGKYATFIEAAIPVRDIEFAAGVPRWNNNIWSEIFREIKRLYENMIIVGWALDLKGMAPKLTPELMRQHREYFGGAHQLFLLMDTLEQDETFFVYKENKLIQKEGFYIYHQARKKENTAPEAEADSRVPVHVPDEKHRQQTDRQVNREYFQKNEKLKGPDVEVELNIPEMNGGRGRYRQIIQEEKKEKVRDTGNLGLALAVAMLVFVVGVGVYENRGSIFGSENSIETNLLQQNKGDETESSTDIESDASGEKNDKIPVEVIP